MKVLFLDVDGVLNRCGHPTTGLEEEKCELLAEVCRRTGCAVVVSSTWRYIAPQYERLLGMLAERGIVHAGKTPCLQEGTGRFRGDGVEIMAAVPRWKEIGEWLAGEEMPVECHAIVDDDPGADDGLGRFVRTGSFEGLTRARVEELVEILGEVMAGGK